ncbi:E3 ubiquitin/ISG15 ligase TRIM25-like isoform X2 [Pogoniulus pusillus]|uniref:E3 ubiquitin/ISG15 ligase TRIM25-like isoform X2 n=1 Tax=Pogoniulus pusillus TaxID=488313 RepID=UPI0030B92477
MSTVMAEGSGEPGRSASLENELSCPICMCLYKSPVILSCGHSFCKQCIQKVLNTQQQSGAPYSCPMCKIQLGPILELQKNYQLCSIVETFLATNSKGQQEDGSKEAHLNKHNAKASQQDHILVEVGTGSMADERRCQEHGKLLECYCQDDGLYICVLCSIAGKHKGHNIITVKEAHGQQLDELSNKVTWLQECEKKLATALEGLQKSEQQVKTNTELVTSQLAKLFDEMKRQISEKMVKIVCDIKSSEEKQLATISEVKEKMKKRRNEAVQHLQSLQQMREQQDVFRFFKEFKLVKDRTSGQDFSVSTISAAVVQMDQARIDSYRHVAQDFLSRLDVLMQQLQRELDNQIHQNSKAASNPSKPSIHINPRQSASGFYFASSAGPQICPSAFSTGLGQQSGSFGTGLFSSQWR